jgi:ubiquinol-cytochrome c reductase iron-sulfur subunit
MSETGHDPQGVPGEEAESRAPHRVIGTPSPARTNTLLGEADGDGAEVAPRELPAEPKDMAGADRSEKVVALLFIISLLASIGFIVAYVGLEVGPIDAVLRSNLALGLSMSVAFLAMAAGFVIWVKRLMPQVEITEERKPLASKAEDKAAFQQTFMEGAEASAFTKRPLLRRTLIAATLPLAAAPIVLLRDLGPLPGTILRRTVWHKGTRLLVSGPNTPLRPADFSNPGQMITVIPEGYEEDQDALSKATTIIIKFAPGELVPAKPGVQGVVMNWTVDNIVAYSKICTHVGCPVALYEQTTHHILCPCHQSTFDATRGAKVIFGPAPRALPQLPLAVNSDGYLVANSDYKVPVGPAFWELGGSGFTGGNESS